MSLLGRLRLAEVRDPSHPLLATGMPDEQRRSRLQWRRAKDAQGIMARWDEIPAERLVHGRYWIEDLENGALYREFGGDPNYANNVCAYFVRDGFPVMLEPTDPPSLREIERRRAAKAQRRVDQAAAAKARYAELRKGAPR